MTEPLVLRGGRVVCPVAGLDARLDVRVQDGHIVALAEGLPSQGERVIDCSGAVVAPGFVDLHADLADPGSTWREDLLTGSEAAAAGGFTTVLVSPATRPTVDSAAVAQDILSRAAGLPGARLLLAGALTVGLGGRELAELGLLVEAGCVALSDGARPISDSLVLRRALEYARPFGVPILLRPGEPALEQEGVMHEGEAALRAGLIGIPAEAEEIGVARAVALARLSGASIHLSHVTTAQSVALLGAARRDGVPITASVPARQLVLTDEDVEDCGYDSAFHVVPPLRPEVDRRALVDALRCGELDAVCSDHVPWTPVDKEHEFAASQPGALGLETALQAALWGLEGDVPAVVRVLSSGPAAVLGLARTLQVGAVADLVVFEPGAVSTVRGPFRSRGVNEPLVGRSLPGSVRATVCGGRLVYGPIRA